MPFSGILGQEKAIRFLKGVLSRERVPHGYLFLGMPGIGKTTTALAMAQALNCLESRDGEACGRCRTCRAIEDRTFEDLGIMEPDGQVIRIEQIRELERSLSFRPGHGRYRVTVIRESERMTEEASNAFLKTLEEPPAGNVLVLHASDLSQIKLTIVSRCQKVRFQPIPVPVIAEWLVREKGIALEQATVLARLSEGSIGKAGRMLEEDFLNRRSECFSQLMTLPDLSDGEILGLVSKLKGKGGRDSEKNSLEWLLSLWKTWMRDLLVLRTGAPDAVAIHLDHLGELKKACDAYRMDSLIEAINLLDQAEKDMSRFRNADLMLENLLLNLKRLGGTTASAEPPKGVSP